MLIYQYDSLNGRFINCVLADADPLNVDRWLMPAFSTTTPVPERKRFEWPFFVDGAWVMKPDYRGVMLYRVDTGQGAEVLVAGIGMAEAGLTDSPRPSEDHVFEDGAWVESPAKVAARVRSQTDAKLHGLMDVVKLKIFGQSDAAVTGLLSPAEFAIYRAWSGYQLALMRIAHSATYPDVEAWPDLPDEAQITADSDLEEAEKHAAAEKAEADRLASLQHPKEFEGKSATLPGAE